MLKTNYVRAHAGRKAAAALLCAGLAVALCPAAALADSPASSEPSTPTAETTAEPAAEAVKTFTVTFNSAKGSAVADQTVNENATATEPAAPTRTGYEFLGWYNGKTVYDFSTPVTANITLKAKWKLIPIADLSAMGYMNSGSKITKAAGKTVGKTSGSKAMTGIAIKKTKKTNVKGSIKYKVYVKGKGWTEYKVDGKIAGAKKSSKKVNGLRVKLTSKLKKNYDVYYRVNVEDYGWMAWAKNGESAGAVNLLRDVRGYQVKLVEKTDKKTAKALKKANKGLVAYATKTKNVEDFMGVVMTAEAQSHSSSTNWLILVDRHINHLCIFKGEKGDWELFRSWRCSTGKLSTPTITGSYSMGYKGYAFGHGYTCYYYSQISGNYLIHSIKYHEGTFSVKDGRLGKNVSKGCVRLALENAKYIYNNVPSGTRIYIY